MSFFLFCLAIGIPKIATNSLTVGETPTQKIKNYEKIIISFNCSIIGGLAFIACSQDEDVMAFDENTIAKRLKFVDVTARINSKQSSTNKLSVDIIIVSWDWGRESRDCKSGFGICNVDWFPATNRTTFPNSNNSNDFSTLLEFDSYKNKYYLDILLAEAVPEDIPLDAISIKIDYDIESNYQYKTTDKLTLHQGSYPFNLSLGVFGGYRIYLD
ncbi:MAG: hypothetical protein Q8S44_06610 [Flavobacteriaceae bacterium]|nr:hypothetical protein [Flavobacteriaceae bacterium]